MKPIQNDVDDTDNKLRIEPGLELDKVSTDWDKAHQSKYKFIEKKL